eukprot:4442517-Pleurochrysis_carterae.AAC.6
MCEGSHVRRQPCAKAAMFEGSHVRRQPWILLAPLPARSERNPSVTSSRLKLGSTCSPFRSEESVASCAENFKSSQPIHHMHKHKKAPDGMGKFSQVIQAHRITSNSSPYLK